MTDPDWSAEASAILENAGAFGMADIADALRSAYQRGSRDGLENGLEQADAIVRGEAAKVGERTRSPLTVRVWLLSASARIKRTIRALPAREGE